MKVWLAYLLLPALLTGVTSLVLPPLMWSLEFGWHWLIYDNVMALNRFERSVSDGSRPLEAFLGGVAVGSVASCMLLVARWYSGRWLHEQ